MSTEAIGTVWDIESIRHLHLIFEYPEWATFGDMVVYPVSIYDTGYPSITRDLDHDPDWEKTPFMDRKYIRWISVEYFRLETPDAYPT